MLFGRKAGGAVCCNGYRVWACNKGSDFFCNISLLITVQPHALCPLFPLFRIWASRYGSSGAPFPGAGGKLSPWESQAARKVTHPSSPPQPPLVTIKVKNVSLPCSLRPLSELLATLPPLPRKPHMWVISPHPQGVRVVSSAWRSRSNFNQGGLPLLCRTSTKVIKSVSEIGGWLRGGTRKSFLSIYVWIIC